MASSIVPQLEAIGLSPVIARQVSETYMKAARDLHAACQASLRSAYRQQASNKKGRVLHDDFQVIFKTLNDAYVQQTGVWVSNALTSARDAVFKTKTAARDTPPLKEKPVFNHEYTPLLEKYFEYNAYPSAPDRAVLARKSMMTPRQIEVWFQNHRNRARKEGKTLRKLSETPLPVDLPLESLEDRMSFFTVPVDERKLSNSFKDRADEFSDNRDLLFKAPSVIMTPSSTSDIDILDPPRPPCAFPTIYTPCDADDLFKTKPRMFKFPPPLWYRHPATHARLPHCGIDMTELAVQFSQKLHLRVSASKSYRSHASQPWCAGRYTLLCPAPHPALIRSARALPTTSISTKRTPVVPASIYPQHTFRSLSPSSSASIVSLQTPSLASTPRKAAGLPKRIPKSESLTRRPGSPDNSPDERDSSKKNRHPSSSSSSSLSSSPTTPVLSSSSLPGDTRSISVSGVDFDCNDDFTDQASKIASPVAKSFGCSAATQPDQCFAFGFDTPVAQLGRDFLH
ncbi:hypothetical protein C0993_002161 [Termitomyces sp. T159_Od127]|nr:hypothetical protein C0993_002161 [Termitomyces sp. T159_Od127]